MITVDAAGASLVGRFGMASYGGAGMADIPRRIKRLIRECAAAAEEAELRRALLPLAEAFEQWKRGEIDSFSLQELIHKFHQGPAREIYLRYSRNNQAALAGAIATGLLDASAVPLEVLEELARLIECFRDDAKA